MSETPSDCFGENMGGSCGSCAGSNPLESQNYLFCMFLEIGVLNVFKHVRCKP